MVVTAQTDIKTKPTPNEQPVPTTRRDTRRITVLGSTGSIGVSTLDLIGRNPDRYEVEALTANRNVASLVEQARRFRPRVAVIGDATLHETLKSELAGTGIETAAGPNAITEAAERPADWIMAAIVGAAGLEPTLAAARQGAVVAFANKECLVCAGSLMVDLIRRSGATLLPVDSEHNAIFQVFDFERTHAVRQLILTASGGPFRTWNREDMAAVTPAQAVAHPTWSMGAKISVDSATMMNKGLEIIEAHFLFGLPEDRIGVVIHPQSIVHSMVEYIDGSVLAQLGTPDMRTPIAYTLAWPERMETPSERLDFMQCRQLSFDPPDPERFPALRLAREALITAGSTPAVLNAANEIAVAAFLAGRVGFLDIEAIVSETLERMEPAIPRDVDDIRQIDGRARHLAEEAAAARSAGR